MSVTLFKRAMHKNNQNSSRLLTASHGPSETVNPSNRTMDLSTLTKNETIIIHGSPNLLRSRQVPRKLHM